MKSAGNLAALIQLAAGHADIFVLCFLENLNEFLCRKCNSVQMAERRKERNNNSRRRRKSAYGKLTVQHGAKTRPKRITAVQRDSGAAQVICPVALLFSDGVSETCHCARFGNCNDEISTTPFIFGP